MKHTEEDLTPVECPKPTPRPAPVAPEIRRLIALERVAKAARSILTAGLLSDGPELVELRAALDCLDGAQ